MIERLRCYPGILSMDIKAVKREGFMMGNNVCISRFFKERVSKMYDKMYPKKIDVHYYIDAGMEEREFKEAEEDLTSLYQDFTDALEEPPTDEDIDDSD